MYVTAPADPIYHLALNDRMTLCKALILSQPDQRRRIEDRRLVADEPKDRVCVLCSQCASLAGDDRSFSQRVSYPTG
jgi:hypothetical protein